MQFQIGPYIIWVGKTPLTIEEERIAAVLLKKRIRLLKEKEIIQFEIWRVKRDKNR